MLVLTRRVDEAIAIGDSIVVTVLGIEGDRVKIGISAPREIPILRHEVFQAVQDQSALQTRLAEQPEPKSFEKLRRLLEEDASEPQDGEPDAPSKEKDE
jgi:carbon storage regulator